MMTRPDSSLCIVHHGPHQEESGTIVLTSLRWKIGSITYRVFAGERIFVQIPESESVRFTGLRVGKQITLLYERT